MKKIPIVHLVLFVLTFITTLAAGALQKGIDILSEPSSIIDGFPFAVTLMTILLIHELSHYLAAKKHHTVATLPYFIPAPTFLGTFGAFIKMKSPIETRRALIDIGASGPLAGFIVSIVACVIGLCMSSVVLTTGSEGVLTLGDSLLFSLLSRVIVGVTPDNSDILLHPIAFAGWIGLFVTSLNLIPIGQLDGGHIGFALLGDKHRKLSIALLVVLAVMGIFFWEGWAFWAGLMVILGIKHPPVLYWEQPLDRQRRITGFIAFIVFIITFVPAPFKLNF
jgi:membrane-associated protease RseP (regulator of RpoE activity)